MHSLEKKLKKGAMERACPNGVNVLEWIARYSRPRRIRDCCAHGALLASQNDHGGISSRFRDTIDYARAFKDQERVVSAVTLAREHSGSEESESGSGILMSKLLIDVCTFESDGAASYNGSKGRTPEDVAASAKHRMCQGETRFRPREMSSARAKGQAAGRTVSY